MSELITQNSLNIFSRYLKSIDTSFYIEKPSEWAEDNRVMPVGGSPYPGPIDMNILPHMIEIMDNAHPDNDIRRVSILKSGQSSATTTVESVMGWAIKHKLHNILMLISSKNIAKLRGSAAVDTMIDNSNLAQYIKPMSNRTSRKSGDSVLTKEFGTHRMMITSYHSIADLKSLSWDLILLDELTEAPKGNFRGQGDVEEIIHTRVKAMRNAVIYKYSTPENLNTCRITKNFNEGDKRYYNVPCPECGEKQVLKLMANGRKYGLTAKYEENKDGRSIIIPDSVMYLCKHCGKFFYEYQKPDIMSGGEWIPTARPINPKFRSYHVSGLMSPIIFYPWTDILSEFAGTSFGKNIVKFKAFVNNALGEAWQNQIKKKSWEFLYNRRMIDSKVATVPKGGLIITGGVDVQKDRLELQLVAWSYGMESWSFDHKVFFGDTSHYDNDVWNSLSDYVYTTKFKIYNSEMLIARVAIDTGHNPGQYRVKDWGQKAHTVYNFVNMNPLFIAVKGIADKDNVLIQEKRNYDVIKCRYDVNVSLVKEDITSKIELDSGGGAIHFVDYPEDFFKQFLSETYCELEKGKWGWKKTNERNETWDTYIYARAAAEHLNLSTYSTIAWDSVMEVANDPHG